MIVEKKKKEQPTVQEESAYNANPLVECYLAVREILETIHIEDDINKPKLFKTIKLDNGQLSRVKNKRENKEFALGFPAVLIHFVNVYYNVGQSQISEGKGTMRLHYILNTLNNSDDVQELEGFKVFQQINAAIQAQKNKYPALSYRCQLKYWDQPLSFDDGLQPYWIDYELWFKDYTNYIYKDYVDAYVVAPPFTDHSDQKKECNTHNHSDHTEASMDDYASIDEDYTSADEGDTVLNE